MELRDLADALRNHMSRSQSQSLEDEDLQVAEPQFNFNSDSWILPSSESEYEKGLEALKHYFNRLSDADATDGQFFSRADNLAAYLEIVSKRLGNLANHLSFAVGKTQYDVSLAGDSSARQSKPALEKSFEKTPWLQIDDVFFEARGYAWALLHTLQAIEIDFEAVLKDKNAIVSLKQISRELEETQKRVWTPWIMNGTGFGPIPNHSLEMASYLSRANAGIIDLRRLLKEG